MELKKKFKKIGFIFGLKREMNLVSNKKNFCVCGYGKSSKKAVNQLLEHGVDIVINFGFAGSISKDLQCGDIVLVDKIFNEKEEKLSALKFDRNLFPNLNFKFKFIKCNLLTVREIVVNKREKAELVKRFNSVSIIDMEAFYIKKELLKKNIPMISLKVIFDDLSFDIPSYIKDCINTQGNLRVNVFLMKLIINPTRIFNLLKVNLKYTRSKKVLEKLINAI